MISMRRAVSLVVLGAVVLALGLSASAQKARSQGAAVTETFTIVGIDQANRIITLKDKDGYSDSMYAGPEVKRFDELKVGDKVTFRYYESVVYQIHKTDDKAAARAAADAAITRGKGPKPSGTVSQQLTATVTVQAIDLKVPSVTIKTEDGGVSSFKVDDKKNLDGVKVGDRVQITYTQALAISVEAGK